jgi:hypothetical protein
MGPPAILERQHIRRERHAGRAQPEEWLGRRCLLPFEWLGARLPSRRQSPGAIDRSLQALVIRRARNSHKDAGQHAVPRAPPICMAAPLTAAALPVRSLGTALRITSATGVTTAMSPAPNRTSAGSTCP